MDLSYLFPLPYELQKIILKINRKYAFNEKIMRLDKKLVLNPMITSIFTNDTDYGFCLYNFSSPHNTDYAHSRFYVFRYNAQKNYRWILRSSDYLHNKNYSKDNRLRIDFDY